MTVTIESALSSVQASAGRLRSAAGDLVLIAVEDQPRGTDVHLVTLVHDAALDLAAEAEQAAAALQQAERPGAATAIAAAARRVANCHARVNALGVVLAQDLAAPERLGELAALGAERGREADAWAREIISCIQSCQRLLWTDMQPALLGYWRELTDITERMCVPATGADR